ncbi:MAG: glycogen/starch synthase [Candidatus Kapabacteria bacterium]|nr:glycogen/starch synthase [Candidatus Kapabacteria bacterium]
MAKPLSILFVSSEVSPFTKIGGVADVAFSYSLAMRELGHDIRVMFPKYSQISERKNKIHEINRLKDILIPVGKEKIPATVKSSSMNNNKVKVQAYIATNDEYFESRKGIYIDPRTGKDYEDNAERFIFFCKSIIETCIILGWFPDIVHANDWQTALALAYVKYLYPKKFAKTKFVFTIHNFGKQGEFPNLQYSKIGLPDSLQNNFLHQKKINFLKAGISFADYVTTVSPAYAKEILKPNDYSNGLHTALEAKKDKFTGIMNGIDTYNWNPKIAEHLKTKFRGDIEGFKTANKSELLNEFDLKPKPNTPLIGMISRIDNQKGFPLLIDSADELFKENIQMVILGDGDAELKKKLQKIQKKYPDKLSLKFEFNEPLSHIIEAGTDMFLMPSLYEACGLNFMYSLNYGSIPIVRAVGGLSDLATDFIPPKNIGNSFSFKNYLPKDLISAVKRATQVYKNQDQWLSLVKNGMTANYSWAGSAKKYDEIYRSLF